MFIFVFYFSRLWPFAGTRIAIHNIIIWLLILSIIGFGLRRHGIRLDIAGRLDISNFLFLHCRLARASRLLWPAEEQHLWVRNLGLGMHSELAWEIDSELGAEWGQIVHRPVRRSPARERDDLVSETGLGCGCCRYI
jgi:hypothetical protein